MTIETLILYGAIAGLIAGLFIRGNGLGCLALIAVPAAIIAFVAIWHTAHPEVLESTSGLDYVFLPLWPTLGALGGFIVAKVVRGVMKRKR